MNFNSLQEWLDYLENKHSQEIQLGLSRILDVAQTLMLQTLDCQVITVAGTNGKGSTISALESLYLSAGYQVGTYTSPHLIEFNERIRVNGHPISDESLCAAFAVIEKGRGDIPLTYFEMTTLAALWYFKQQKLDLVLLEVGLGGRHDATNIVDSDLAVITTIDFDHQEYLGNTLDAIGYQKAGILRFEKPFIYADANPPASIVNEARLLNVGAFWYGKDYQVEAQPDTWTFKCAKQTMVTIPKPSIQLQSAAAALMASFILENKLPLTLAHRLQGMERVFVPGRLQLHKGDVSFLFDVSHNPQSAKLLAQKVQQLQPQGTVHAIFSALKDKDIFGLIQPLIYCVNRWYPAQLEGKRAASASQILASFKEAEINTEICYNSPLIAFEKALEQARAGDLILVYGSFFTVGQVMGVFYNSLKHKENT